MAKKNSGCGMIIFIVIILSIISSLINSFDQEKIEYTPSSISNQNYQYEKNEDPIPYYEQTINCDLGSCGKKNLTRNQCSTYVCCKIGSTYSIAISTSSCNSQQQAYLESIKPIYTTPSYSTTKSSCCKYCTKGKACGDSCISKSYTCHKPPGCACDR